MSRAVLLSALAALFLAVSCAEESVGAFIWKDAAGASVEFSQSSSWPRGEEGAFKELRRSNRYSLKSGISAREGESLEVALRCPADARSRGGVSVSLSPKKDGSSPSISAKFPLLADRVELILPLDPASRIASLSVGAQGEKAEFTIESISIAPAFRGILSDKKGLRVSAGFSLAKGPGYEELSIARPLNGLRAAASSGGGPGVVLEYGPAPAGSILRLEARRADGSSRTYSLRTHPAGARTALDSGIVSLDTTDLRLRAPEGVDVRAFYAASLEEGDFELADLGRVLLSDATIERYSLYRWDLLPSVLIFDFKDYATQDSYLKRLAFFVEKIGYRGLLAKDEEIAGLHGWNAHDYGPEDLAAFFRAAKKRSFPLGADEKELEALLASKGVIEEKGDDIEPGKGAMISISRESGAALRWLFATHESTHAIFFSDAEYRNFARSLWSSLDAKEKWFWKTYLGWAGYDVGSDYLAGNEFQAYLLQQPVASAEEYFTKRKSAELLEKHPELEGKVAQYMDEYGKSFALRARELERWLAEKYGIEAGRTVFLTRR